MVIKLGGSILDDAERTRHLAQDIVLLAYVGVEVVVVHGGGKHISALLKRLGKQSQFIDGLRVTDAETMEITQMVLSGWLNKNLTGVIECEGGRAVGISGKDASLMRARQLTHAAVDYGFVGDIEHINTDLVEQLLAGTFIPVISPIASDGAGGTLNVNGDIAAGELAAALQAVKLIYITDVHGIYSDAADPKTLLPTLRAADVAKLMQDGVLTGGMVPKVQLAQRLLTQTKVEAIHLISGQISHALLVELFTEKGIGTKLF